MWWWAYRDSKKNSESLISLDNIVQLEYELLFNSLYKWKREH